MITDTDDRKLSKWILHQIHVHLTIEVYNRSATEANEFIILKLTMIDSKAKRCRQWAAVNDKVHISQGNKACVTYFLVQMLHLKARGYYLRALPKNQTVYIKPCLQVLPVEGWWVSLGLAAEHHLSAVLARLKGKHHTARLLGEHGPQQDAASWVENQQ